jgi:RimJ/RimL family protein N-acetyltransferase
MTLTLRLATPDDLDEMMTIVDDAKALLKSEGIPQWQSGKPNRQTLGEHMSRGWLYALDADPDTDNASTRAIAAFAVIMQEPDLNYEHIHKGSWKEPPSHRPEHYATFHNFAVSNDFHGRHIAHHLLAALISQAQSLGFPEFRIDTHEKNLRMRHVIEQFDFEYRGVIYLDDNPSDPRYAYQMFV